MLIIDNTYTLHPDYQELADYFGVHFILDWCDATDQKIVTERARFANEIDFIRNTFIFCYQSLGLTCQGIQRPYLAEFLRRTADQREVTVMDVGSGGGQVGLALHTLGYRVSFADLYSQSMLFVEYRLRRRGLDLPVFFLDNKNPPMRHQWAICFDMLEHLTEQARYRWLERLAGMADHVLVNLIGGDGTELPGLHTALDIEAVTDFISQRWKAEWGDCYPDERTGKPRARWVVFGGER